MTLLLLAEYQALTERHDNSMTCEKLITVEDIFLSFFFFFPRRRCDKALKPSRHRRPLVPSGRAARDVNGELTSRKWLSSGWENKL